GDCSGDPAATSEDRRDPAGTAADAARVALREDHRRREDVVGGHHLTTAHVRVLTELATVRERPLLHHVLHAEPALDHQEAVRLLDHEADETDGRAELIARERAADVVLRLHDGERTHRLVTVLEIRRAL